MPTFRNFFILLNASGLLMLMGCTNGTKNNNTQDSKLPPGAGFEYQYHDATKPPPYHRSYTISVKEDMVRLEINSYEDVLLKDSVLITKEQFLHFADAVTALHIRAVEEKKEDDCTGGSSEHLDLYTGTPNEISGRISHCGPTDSGTLEGDVAACIALFKAMIPDLEKKIGSTMEKTAMN